MKIYQISNKFFSCAKLLLCLALSSCILFGLSSCGLTPKSATDSAASAQETDTSESSDESSQANEVSSNSEPLTVDDATQSITGYGAIGALDDTDLSLLDMLTYAVQDEYLARGEYLAIMDEYGDSNPYKNIAAAEEKHLSLLKGVYDSYELVFPDDTSSEHIVVPDSLLEAAETGVNAEIDNIAMYKLFLSYNLPDDVEEVFTALRDASESHLMAFQKQVEKLS
ncbi:MAG: hypothetical protein VB112_08665 [Oscillospiraceae bacterium]|nr:hypothetical protein [Oscillospiraceae bacterium]